MEIHKRVNEILKSPHPVHSAKPLVGKEDNLVVAVSGGPDSLSLLNLLVEEDLHPADRLLVAHLDHSLRPSSEAESVFVLEQAAALGVACVIEKVNIRELAATSGWTSEEAGRNARYEFLARVARNEGAGVVVTGHTADDQAETVLMNLFRGSGPRGLRGMLVVGAMPGCDDIILARPLLSTTKQEVEEYCEAHDLRAVADKSNQDPSYTRNWIRLEMLPKVRERFPAAVEQLRQTAEIIASDYELLDGILGDTWSFLEIESGAGWMRLDRSVWRVLPTSLRRSTLRKAVELARNDEADIGFRTIELARNAAEMGQVGTEATLPDGVRLVLGYDTLLVAGAGVEAPPPDVPQLPDATPHCLPVPGKISLAGNWVIESTVLEIVDLSAVFGNINPWQAFVYLPDVVELVIRTAFQGEKYQPLGLGGHSASIQDVMVNRKIPSALRTLWPVVSTADHLVWLAGHQIDHRVQVKDKFGKVIQLSIEKLV
jgi:tRNA(Ile)-lysidine synthase